MPARRPRLKLPRFASLCVPGKRGDGRDATWFVLDRRNMRTEYVGMGAAARSLAHKATRNLNGGRTVEPL